MGIAIGPAADGLSYNANIEVLDLRMFVNEVLR